MRNYGAIGIAIILGLVGFSGVCRPVRADGPASPLPPGVSQDDMTRFNAIRSPVSPKTALATADVDWLIAKLKSYRDSGSTLGMNEVISTLLVAILSHPPVNGQTGDQIFAALDPVVFGKEHTLAYLASFVEAQVNEDQSILRLRTLIESSDPDLSHRAHIELRTIALQILSTSMTSKAAKTPPAKTPNADSSRVHTITSRTQEGLPPASADVNWVIAKLSNLRSADNPSQATERVRLLRVLAYATCDGCPDNGMADRIYQATSPFLTGFGAACSCAVALTAAQLNAVQAIPRLRSLASNGDPLTRRAARYALLRLGATGVADSGSG